MSTSTEKKSILATVVPTAAKFPTAIIIVGSLLLLLNLFFLFSSLFNVQVVFPGLGTDGVAKQVQYMFAARQFSITLVFALALYGKNVRFMQLAWFLAFVRELGDLAGALAFGANTGALFIIPILVFEFAVFIYMGAIASGRVAKYKPQA